MSSTSTSTLTSSPSALERKLLPKPIDDFPKISTNGLRIAKRRSDSVRLKWTEDICEDGENNVQVQMKYGDDHCTKWITIFKGYGLSCRVDNLIPNSLLYFRMKRNEGEWGTQLISLLKPISSTDLSEAVDQNSVYLTRRVLEDVSFQMRRFQKMIKEYDENGMTPLMVAVNNGNVEIVKTLLDYGCKVDSYSIGMERTPLMFACRQGMLKIVKILDKHGANWLDKDATGCNLLHHAVNGGNLTILIRAYEKIGDAFEPDYSGWTPLLRAVILSDKLDILKFLVKKGDDLNFIDKQGESVLMTAIRLKKTQFVKTLLEYGADPFYKKRGRNCLDLAEDLGFEKIAKLILQAMQILRLYQAGKEKGEINSFNSRHKLGVRKDGSLFSIQSKPKSIETEYLMKPDVTLKW